MVLTEALTGDHRRDFDENRLIRACQVHDVDELLARHAALLRAATGRAGDISATDAIVVALADARPDPVVLTSNPTDIEALAAQSAQRIVVERI